MEQYLEVAKQLLDQYPKTKQQLLEWQMIAMEGMQADMLEQMGADLEGVTVPEVTEALAEQMLYVSFISNHRFLFDFFDSKKLHVSIVYDEGNKFVYAVNGEMQEKKYNTRVEAEQEAFKAALQTNENQ